MWENALHRVALTRPLGIVLLYVVLGSGWILFSHAMLIEQHGTSSLTAWHQVGEWGGLALSALLLYALMRRGQRRLQEKNRELETILATAPVAIITLDRDAHITRWSAGAEAVFGWTAEDVKGGSVPFVPADHQVEFQDMVEQVLEGQTHRNVEVRRHRKDGTPVDVSLAAAPLRDEEDSVIGIVAALADITSLKMTQQQLHRGQELLQKLFDTIPVMIVMYNPALGDFRVNKAFERTLGWTAEDAQERDLMAACYPDPSYRAEVRAFMQSLDPGWRDFEVTTKAGHTVETSWTNIRLSDDTQVGIGIDISARKARERELREREERFERVVRAITNAVWDWDLQTDTLWWSEGLHEVFGYEEEAVQPTIQWWATRIHEADRDDVVASIHAAIETGEEAWESYYRFYNADGSVAHVFDRGYIVHDDAGRPIRMIGAMQDITARTRAARKNAQLVDDLRAMSQRLLEAQEQERRRVAQELHDEVGALLTALQICLDAAHYQLQKQERSSALVAGARDELREAQQLTDTLGEQVRQLALNLRPSVLDDLGLAAALQSLADRHRKRTGLQVQLHHEVEAGQRFAEAVETVAYRVVQEALTNVARHAQVDAVQVLVNVVEDRMRLHVIDEGIGFDADRVAQHRTMGLDGMRKRVELLGGTFEMATEPGEGTRISATLPLISRS